MTPASWASARRLRRAHWHERAIPFADLAGESVVMRVALDVQNRVSGLPSSSSRTECTVQKIRCPPWVTEPQEAWGHETAVGENRGALAHAGRWVSSVLDTTLAGEEARVVAVDLQDPRDYQIPGIDERKSHRASGSAREPPNNDPTLSEP
jgi:hypothetical protein